MAVIVLETLLVVRLPVGTVTVAVPAVLMVATLVAEDSHAAAEVTFAIVLAGSV